MSGEGSELFDLRWSSTFSALAETCFASSKILEATILNVRMKGKSGELGSVEVVAVQEIFVGKY